MLILAVVMLTVTMVLFAQPARASTGSEPAPSLVTLSLSAGEVAAGETVTYSGAVTTATGAPASGAVTLQKRRDGGSWLDWRTLTLSASGAYAVAVRMTTPDRVWELRARMPGDGASSLTAYSQVQTLTVSGGGYAGVVAIAQRCLGVPYVWGGASPSGFDCSGLAMYCYAQVGVKLPRGATDQQRAGSPVSLSDLRSGDLVFFGSTGYSYHVGVYVGGGQMIDAPYTGAVVRYDSIAGAWIGGRW